MPSSMAAPGVDRIRKGVLAMTGLRQLGRWLRNLSPGRAAPGTTLGAAPRPPASLLIVAANDRDAFSAQAFDLEATLAAVNQDRLHFDHEPVKP